MNEKVYPALELQQVLEGDVLPLDHVPAPIDIMSIARGSRPTNVANNPLYANNGTSSGNSTDEMNYAQRGFYAQTTAIQLLPFRVNRSYFFIQNHDSANNMYVSFGVNVDTNVGIKLPPGAIYEPYKPPVDTVYVMGSGANTEGMVIEGFIMPRGSHIVAAQEMLNRSIAVAPPPAKPTRQVVLGFFKYIQHRYSLNPIVYFGPNKWDSRYLRSIPLKYVTIAQGVYPLVYRNI